MRRWLLPEHIEDILPAEALTIEGLRRAILDRFQSHGYELVAPPLLEYVESLLSGTGEDLDLATFKLVDRLSGRGGKLPLRPGDYFRRQVRVSSFAYELPRNIERMLNGANLLMCCSDFPHSEGTARPLDDYAAPGKLGVRPADAPGLFHDNAAFLLGRQAAREELR